MILITIKSLGCYKNNVIFLMLKRHITRYTENRVFIYVKTMVERSYLQTAFGLLETPQATEEAIS